MTNSSYQLAQEMQSALHRMWWDVRLLRAYNQYRDTNICGVQYHKFIFDRLIESFVYFLIVDVCAITDVNNQRGATFTTWLKMLIDEESNPEDKTLFIAVQSDYYTICNSDIYQGIKARRDKAYAHKDQDRHTAFSLPGNTFGNLFGVIESLIQIYDRLAQLKEAPISIWSGAPDASLYQTVDKNADISPEELMNEFLKTLESAKHREDWHHYLNENSPSGES